MKTSTVTASGNYLPWPTWLKVAAVMALSIFVYAPLLVNVPGRDGGLFLYIGQGLLLGEVPYLEAWDHKPPLIYFTNALGLVIAGGRYWGVWILAVLAVSGAGWCSFRALRRAHGEAVAAAVTVLWILTTAGLIGESINTELFTLPLQMGALLTLLQWRGEPERRQWPMLLGALAGLAFLYRQNHLGTFVAAFAVGTLVGGGWRGITFLGRSFLYGMIGTTAALAPVVIYIVAQGSWNALWDAAFHYNFIYAFPGFEARQDALAFGFERIRWAHGAVLVWLVAVIRLVARRSLPGGTRGALLWTALLALPLEFYLSTASGRLHAHYFALWLAALVPLLAELLGFLARPGQRSPRRAMVAQFAAIALGLLALGTLYLDGLRWRWEEAFDPNAQPDVRRTVEYLREHTGPEEASLIWGSDAVLLALAERRSATRYVFQYALITPGYKPNTIAAEFLDDLARRPPAVIVDTGHHWFPSLDEQQRRPTAPSEPFETRGSTPLPPRMDEFFEMVAADYELVTTYGRYAIYGRRR